MGEVFVSYSHHDTAYVEKLAKRLRKVGLKVWLDSEIDYGSRWPAVIEEHLSASAAVILVMSTAAKASDWVQNELEFAKSKGKPMFPILLDGDPFLQFQTTLYPDVRNRRLPPAAFFDRLLATVSQTAVSQRDAPPSSATASHIASDYSRLDVGLYPVTRPKTIPTAGSELAQRILREVTLLGDRPAASFVEVSGSKLAHAHATPQDSNTWRIRISAPNAEGYRLSLRRPGGQFAGEALQKSLEGAGWNKGLLDYTSSSPDAATAAHLVVHTFTEVLGVDTGHIKVEVRQGR